MKKLLPLLTLILLSTSFAYAQYPRDQQLQAAEYFLNSDPGEGYGTAININISPDVTINLNLNVPVGTKIYIRFQSTNGTWSAPRCIKRYDYFVTTGATLQYGEYFINNDPGQGNATPINISNGTANLNNQNLQQGDVVYFRIRDSYNRWSPARGFKYQFKEMRRADYKIRLGTSGNYTTPVILTTTAAPDNTCPYSCSKNNIDWHVNDSIFIRYQTMEGFYSKWINGIVADAGNDQTICQGESATLTATGGQSYLWSDGQAGSTISVIPDITTTYDVTVSSGPGITSVDSVTVFVNLRPPAPSITQDGTTLTSNAPTGNQWYNQNGLIIGATSQTYSPTNTGDYYVIVTLNGCSSLSSNIIHYFPLTAPTVSTEAATNITSSSAVLNAMINANNFSTAVTFDYGFTTTYEYTVNANPDHVNGNFNILASFQLTGLNPDTTYHYRVVAVNEGGTSYGLDKSFSTSVSGIIDITANDRISIYPNPANDHIIVEDISFTKDEMASIINVHGKLLLQRPMKQAKIEIDISALAIGVYILIVRDAEHNSMGKFVKE